MMEVIALIFFAFAIEIYEQVKKLRRQVSELQAKLSSTELKLCSAEDEILTINAHLDL